MAWQDLPLAQPRYWPGRRGLSEERWTRLPSEPNEKWFSNAVSMRAMQSAQSMRLSAACCQWAVISFLSVSLIDLFHRAPRGREPRRTVARTGEPCPLPYAQYCVPGSLRCLRQRGRDKPEETLEHHSNAGANGRTATVAFVTIAISWRHPPGNLSCSRAKAKQSTSAEAPALPMHSICQCGRTYKDSGYRSSLFRWV